MKIKFKEWWYVFLLIISGAYAFAIFFPAIQIGSLFQKILFLFLFLLKIITIFLWAYNNENFRLFLRIWTLFYVILFAIGFFGYLGLIDIQDFDYIDHHNILFDIPFFLNYLIILILSGKQIKYVKLNDQDEINKINDLIIN